MYDKSTVHLNKYKVKRNSSRKLLRFYFPLKCGNVKLSGYAPQQNSTMSWAVKMRRNMLNG